MTAILCKKICQIPTGFIVEAPWPHGPGPSGYEEAICKTFNEVIDLLRRYAMPENESSGA